MLRLGKDYKGILGAAIGDVSGSYIEFRPNEKPKTPEEAVLFHEGCGFTDDTVMTAAVADCLKQNGKEDIADTLQKWGRRYPNAGYGGRFIRWLFDDKMQSYDSFGNGSAMRTSAIAYYAESEEEAIELAMMGAIPSHGHPEGIKGAMVVTQIIFRALHGATKEELRQYAATQYDFESLDYEEMKSFMGHGQEICKVTVPQALWAFFNTDSFEECLRVCHTIGWDADTLADIACAMAEAYYKEIPEWIVLETQKRLPKDIREALESVPVPVE